jgi:hypothetical protein
MRHKAPSHGRMITNNALIVFEYLHAINNGNRGCRNFRAYKLDLTKAYEQVDYRCLEGICNTSAILDLRSLLLTAP